MNRSELLEQVAVIAKHAGEKILEVYNSEDFEIEEKNEDSFVSPLTKADKQASEYIVTELAKISEYPIVSEENDVRSVKGPYWLVDPLDGTKEFVKRGGDFTVNIAFIEECAPTMGVVYAPVLDRLYVGDTREHAAFREDATGRTNISATSVADTPVVVASKSHRNEETEAFLAKLGDHEAQSIGSSLKLCLVAEGQAMLYPRLGPTSLWDTAAADAVVRAAGGSVKTLEGESLVYDISKGTLNPFFVVEAANNSLHWN